MKKILSLLSVLTISGTAVPTTIAASPYQKEEIIKNSEINYSQVNNLEKLNINKIENNKIFTTETLNFNFDVKEYFKNLCKIMKNLLDKKIILNVSDSLSGNETVCDSNYFSINSNSNYNYFIIPILFEGRYIQLIFRSSDFYLQGFTVITNNQPPLSLYYHFSDSTITELGGYTSRSFGFDGNYNTLMPDADQATVRWDNNITQAFWDIINYGDNPNSQGNIRVIRGALARVILATAESIRFRKARNSIINYVPNESTWGFYHSFITRWNTITEEAINYIEQYGTLNRFWASNIILMFTAGMDAHLHSCNKKNAKDLNDNEYCFNVPDTIFHWRDDKKSFEIINDWYDGEYHIWSGDFKIGLINPSNYNRIEFLGDTSNSKISWGGTAYYAKSGFDLIENSNFQSFLKNGNDYCDGSQIILGGPVFTVQNLNETWWGASIEGQQKFAFCSYIKESNYYLKVSTLQSAKAHASSIYGSLFLYLGRGLRLYNN